MKRLHWSSMPIQGWKFLLAAGVFALQVRPDAHMAEYLLPVAVFLFGTLVTVIRWRRFRYWIEGDRLRAVDGGLFKKETDIPLDKIHALDGSTSILHRMFGVTRLQVKTASDGTQLDLTAVSEADANDLRRMIEGGGATAKAHQADLPPENVRKLTPVEIVVAAATSKQFIVAIAGITWVFEEISAFTELNFIESLIEMIVKRQELSWATIDWTAVLIAGAVVVLGWVASAVWTLLLFRSYTVSWGGGRLKIRRGFTDVREVAVPVIRIQSIEITQSPLQVLFGFGELRIHVIGHTEEKGVNTVLHPCLHKSEWEPFLEQLGTAFEIADGAIRAPAKALPLFLLRAAAIPLFAAAVAVGAFMFVNWQASAAALALAIPAVIVLAAAGLLAHRMESIAYGVRSLTFVHQGWTRLTAVIRRDAWQTSTIRQNLIQEKLGLATLGLEVASGNHGVTRVVRHVEAAEAERFSNWLATAT